MQTSARIRLQANAPCIARNASQKHRLLAPLARCCNVTKQEQALLWFEHISKPVDCLPTAKAVLCNVQSMLDAVDLHQDAKAALADIELYKLSLLPGLQLLADRHPDSAWRQAAAAAQQLLEHGTDSLIADWKQAREAAAVAPGSSSSSSTGSTDSTGSTGSSNSSGSSSSSSTLLHELQQLQDWLHELLSLEAAAKAAAVQAVQSSDLSPVLLISQQQAQQHPAWAADYQAWQQQQQQQQTDAAAAAAAARNSGSKQEHSTGSSVAGGAVSHQSGNITGAIDDSTTGNTTSSGTTVGTSMGTCFRKLLLLLPAIHDLHISDEVTLPVGQYYAAAAASAAGNNNIQLLSPKQGPTLTSQTTTEDSRSFMPWPLTAAATAVLLSSPPGVLSQGQLQAVQLLGLEARVQVLAAAVDLVYLLQQEIENTKGSLKAAFAHMGITAAPSYGKAVAPTQNCRDNSGSSGGGSSSSSTYGASRHPAVAAAFLDQLAGFCKQTAAEELQSWLSICTQANLANLPPSSSSSSSIDWQQQQQQQQQQPAGWQLPDSLGSLHPYQVEGLRQAVAIIETEQIAHQSVSSSGMIPGQLVNSSRNFDVNSWLADYTDDTLQLLQGACELLGSTLNLSMNCTVAPVESSWCEEGYVITVADDSSGRQRQRQWPVVESCSSSSSLQLMGEIWVLFDPHYTGLPYTTAVSQGGFYKVLSQFSTLRRSAQASPHTSERQCGTWSSTALQPCKVVIIFPEQFGSAGSSGVNAQIDGSSSCSSTASGSSSSSTAASPSNKLSTLLHEFGHALHFVLSATAAAASAADCGCWAACDICETVAHLTERMTRDMRCLQVLLRHKTTHQPPPLQLTKQLQMHMVISNRGAYQWQQHVIAALVDAKLAAAAAAAAAVAGGGGSSSGSCWDVLQDVRQKYDPLSPKQGLHPSVLTYLPMAAVMPGNAYSYVFAELISAAVWAKYLNSDPLDPAAGLAVRRLLFEASATQSTEAVVERLLGKGSMHPLVVNLGQISSSSSSTRTAEQVVGYVPNLEHEVFQDIDLWA